MSSKNYGHWHELNVVCLEENRAAGAEKEQIKQKEQQAADNRIRSEDWNDYLPIATPPPKALIEEERSFESFNWEFADSSDSDSSEDDSRESPRSDSPAPAKRRSLKKKWFSQISVRH